MFPYTVKNTESESDIQNINLMYKINQQCQHIFELLEHFEKFKSSNYFFMISLNSIINILYFGDFL